MEKFFLPISEELPRFALVQGPRGARYPFSLSVLIRDAPSPGEATLIDSGPGLVALRQVSKQLSITRVCLSHWHEDHTSGNKFLARRGAKFFYHSLDAPAIENPGQVQDMYTTRGTPVADLFIPILEALDLVGVSAEMYLQDGDCVQIGGGRAMEVIHAPGHSAGHCCFYEPTAQFLFLGDIDLTSFGPWYGGRDSSLGDFATTIARLLTLPVRVAVSSHKGLFTEPAKIRAALSKYLNVITQRDERILEILAERIPRSIDELVGHHVVYREYGAWKDYCFIAEQIMIAQHLVRLEQQGKVKAQAGKWVLH